MHCSYQPCFHIMPCQWHIPQIMPAYFPWPLIFAFSLACHALWPTQLGLFMEANLHGNVPSRSTVSALWLNLINRVLFTPVKTASLRKRHELDKVAVSQTSKCSSLIKYSPGFWGSSVGECQLGEYWVCSGLWRGWVNCLFWKWGRRKEGRWVEGKGDGERTVKYESPRLGAQLPLRCRSILAGSQDTLPSNSQTEHSRWVGSLLSVPPEK